MNALALVRPLAASLYRFQKAKASAFSWNHDVFSSFRDPDHHKGFVGFLYEGLVAAGHRVFRDEAYGLQQKGKASAFPWSCYDVFLSCREGDTGTPFADFLYKSLEAVGLRELAEIMGCRGKHGKSVFPVFYKLGVDDLRRLHRKLEEALCGQQCRGEEAAGWAEALCSLTRITGWMSLQAIADGREEEGPVAEVLSELLMTRWSSTFMRLVDLYFWEKKRRESEKRRRECQVFLAFRGPDTGPNLAAYLRTSLLAEGIRVFDEDDIAVGDELYQIYEAIHRCKISIPIISENFASSHHCLHHLAEMVECKRTKGQQILPIFYKVEPSYVRDLSHVFGEHMLRYKKLVEEKTREWIDETTYDQWERALKEVGSSEGWVSEKIADGDERELVNRVVKEVARLLDSH